MPQNFANHYSTMKGESPFRLLETVLMLVKEYGTLSVELLKMEKRLAKKREQYREYQKEFDTIFYLTSFGRQGASRKKKLLDQRIADFKAFKISLRELESEYKKKNSEKFFLKEKILNLAEEAGRFFPEIHNGKLTSINDINLKLISRFLQKRTKVIKKNRGDNSHANQ